MSVALETILLDHSREILLLVDPRSLVIVEASKPSLRLLGYRREELLGREITDIECALSDVFYWEEVRQGSPAEVQGIESTYQCASGDTLLATKSVSRVECAGDAWLVVCAEPLGSRRDTENELAYATSRLSATLEATADGILLLDRGGRIVNMNQRFSRLWGLPDELLLRHDDNAVFSFMAGTVVNTDAYLDTLTTIQPDADKETFDILHLTDGRIIERKSRPARQGELIFGRVFSFVDVTEIKNAESGLRIAATAFESQEAMVITDADRVILKVNNAFTRITGYSSAEAVGKTPAMLKSGRHDAQFYRAMRECLDRDHFWQGEIWNRRKSGEIYPEWLNITAVINPDGQATQYVASFSDITARKAAEDEINTLAFYDQLTGLPNRTLLLDRLKQARTASARSGGFGALMLIDLDHFKTLNDTAGHDMGDLLLKQVAQRLSACVRAVDTVARLGGDEFVVLLAGLSSIEGDAATRTEAVGERILASLNQTYQLKDVAHHSTPSIGATLFKGDQAEIEVLLKQADLAMYKSKDAGRNALHFFDADMEVVVMKRAALEKHLREAIKAKQFLLHYQAQVVNEGRLTGAEVLVRWQHPQRGMVSPAEFIPLAEETGLILPLGQWVLETACAQLAAWASRPQMAHLTVAVNVSAHQFRQRDFVDQVLAILESAGADPHKLKLELTESMLVSSVEDIIEKMFALRAKGVGFSLDDFGTGYSSLTYLKRLPLDQLKIDQSFVRDVLSDPNDASIAKTIIALAQNLGLGVIAEGVETAEQRDFLAGAGCHAYQGYFFSRPLPIAAFEEFAKRI